MTNTLDRPLNIAIIGRQQRPAANTWDGYLSAVMCIAADRSVDEGQRVHLRYPAGDQIEMTSA